VAWENGRAEGVRDMRYIVRLSRYSISFVTLAFLSVVNQVEASDPEPITLPLECKGLMNEYRRGTVRWATDTTVYYRIKLHASYAAVEFRTEGRTYSLADKYDMKSSESFYELAGWWNNSKFSENIKIDRLNGNFSSITINEETEEVRGFGACYKIDDTPKF
jgi:hypothetical protein